MLYYRGKVCSNKMYVRIQAYQPLSRRKFDTINHLCAREMDSKLLSLCLTMEYYALPTVLEKCKETDNCRFGVQSKAWRKILSSPWPSWQEDSGT